MVYVPINYTSESYICAYKDTNVIVDGLQIRLEADHYLPIQQGLHEIRSDADILIQITHWPNIPAFQGLYNFSSIIPAVQMAGVKENVKAVPLVVGGLSLHALWRHSGYYSHFGGSYSSSDLDAQDHSVAHQLDYPSPHRFRWPIMLHA